MATGDLLDGFHISALAGGGRLVWDQLDKTHSPPQPPPPPPPAVGIIPSASTTQEFAVKGGSFTSSASLTNVQGPSVADNQQIRIRYDASDQHYEVQLPGSSTWERLNGSAGDFSTVSGATFSPLINGYNHSTLAGWADVSFTRFGYVAAGIGTLTGGVPTTGSATYNGHIYGTSTETSFDQIEGTSPTAVTGAINLGFNFGAGTLSGSVRPTLTYPNQSYDLAPLNFTNTVYSSGSPVFSGKFATSLPGLNAFSGKFTGPAATELIGSFAFPYNSPVDSKVYEAGGAFIAKRP
jgi:hypothetical protein